MKSAAFLFCVGAMAVGAVVALVGCARRSEPKPEPVAAESASLTTEGTGQGAANGPDAGVTIRINGEDYKIVGKAHGTNRQQRERLNKLPMPGEVVPAEK